MPPIVTLVSDFGLGDHYVAAMKGAVLRCCASVCLIDVTHQVPPQDILAGSFVLERAVADFPEGTVHLAVVDPGVGTRRRMLVVRVKGQFVVCPDNGLITWTWRRHRGSRAYAIRRSFPAASSTFHGRDIMGPVAGMIAAGVPLVRLARPVAMPKLLDVAPARSSKGRIIYIDHFGNVITNIPRRVVDSHRAGRVCVNGAIIGSVKTTYADIAAGQPLALVGSSDLLEIAVRNGSAAGQLDLHIGDEVYLKC